MKRVYFDNAASTPLDKRVFKAMKPYLIGNYGNPSSLHKEGKVALQAIEKARQQVADALCCDPSEIYFTSGASESNSWVSRMASVSPDEKSHNSIYEVPHNTVTFLDVKSFAMVNNETGSLDFYDYENKFGISHHHFHHRFHVDATQAVGKIDINLALHLEIAFLSLSAHKINGPKGVGVLYIRKGLSVSPLIYGSQEKGNRGGTENVAGIVGLGKAIELAAKEMNKNNKKIEEVVDYIYDNVDNSQFVTFTYHQETKQFESSVSMYGVTKKHKSNHIINITFKTLNAQTAVQLFDRYGIAISAGSACNSDSQKASRVLLASGYNERDALRTIRVSIGSQNTKKEAKRFCKVLREIIDKYDN